MRQGTDAFGSRRCRAQISCVWSIACVGVGSSATSRLFPYRVTGLGVPHDERRSGSSADTNRLDRSLDAIRLTNPLSQEEWAGVFTRLLEDSGPADHHIYLQVTRGPAPRRDHAFPAETRPTSFAMVYPAAPPDPELIARGASAITLPDIRWQLCDIKAVTLLANVLLRQQAEDAGAAEAILLRDGYAYEGTSTNLFLVRGGRILTPPLTPRLLPGITRDLVVELARNHGLDLQEQPVTETELRQAEEIWITSSTKEVLAVTTLDGAPVDEGVPGPVWQRVRELFQDYKRALRDGRAG